MNYRHLYHAGNFADVFKHVVLVLLIQALQRKDKPFCYLDTHAGIGRSDLFSEAAQKSREYENGILTLLKQTQVPQELSDYLAAIRAVNTTADLKSLQFYPGSPRIVRHLLRKDDRMILSELHPEDVQLLKQEFFRDKQVAVHHLDGYQALKAFLPPKERRGLVFIDPPYEHPDEFKHIMQALRMAYQRWASGIYATWYPLKNSSEVEYFYRALRQSEIEKILIAELSIYPADSLQSLNGSGMAIINPPWKLDEELKQLLPWLWQVLSPEKCGEYHIKWLKT